MSILNNGIENSMINIDTLHKTQQNILERKYEIYEIILKKCHSRIKSVAKSQNNMSFCFFSIPKYIFGIPLYDNKSCILYLISALMKNGFDIRYTHPNLLFVSWFGKTNQNRLAIMNNNNNDTNKYIKQEPNYKTIDSYRPSGHFINKNNQLNDIDRKLFNILN